MEGSLDNLITIKFLEDNLERKVERFSVKRGTKPGENFMSTIYSIFVQFRKSSDTSDDSYTTSSKSDCQTIELLQKCYPSHPSDQKYLNKRNLFYKELSFYTTVAKDLTHFQTQLVGISPEETIPLPIPHFVGGKAIDYSQNSQKAEGELCAPLDNYILMEDMRTLKFKMPDSRISLDGEQMKLAFIELATIHALSWAYKQKFKVDLQEKYSFLKKKTLTSSDLPVKDMWMDVFAENANRAIEAIDSTLGAGNNLSQSIKKFSEVATLVAEFFRNSCESTEILLRDKLRKKTFTENLPIWRVLCHGDCWTNNLLIQNDPVSHKPLKMIFVDFALSKLSCPTLDLSCLVYTSTRRHFRQSHLNTCLELYHNRFLQVCEAMKLDAEALPEQFTLQVLHKKFHIFKLVGFFIALLSLPLNLIEKKNEDNIATTSINENSSASSLSTLISEASNLSSQSSLYKEWILELTKDLYDEGVI